MFAHQLCRLWQSLSSFDFPSPLRFATGRDLGRVLEVLRSIYRKIFTLTNMKQKNIEIIDNFYKQHCNGEWEHLYGFTIETCDNPGWLLTITDLDIYNKSIQRIYSSIINKQYSVSVTHVHEPESITYAVKIFGSSLENVIGSAADFIKYFGEDHDVYSEW